MTIWGIGNRNSFEAAVQAQGLYTRKDTRVSQSWDPASPDSTLSTARTKELLGEFAYLLNSSGSISIESGWVSANLPAGRELLNNQIQIRARCHNDVAGDLRAALADVAAAGLGGAIEVSNANTYGGCYNPRFSRTGGELGFVSRHTWGQALDTNTVSNCQGCVPRMHCDVVRIFRRHGFAWGGNFRRPDGMHFEWVGERRDQIAYPSKYCPNIGSNLTERETSGSSGGLFVEIPDEIADEHVAAP